MSNTALAIRDDQQTWTDMQHAALVQLGVEQANEGDLNVFFHQCKTRKLDPFLKQIYMIGRNSKEMRNGREVWTKKYTIQTSIDGLRLIARRAADARHETYGYEDTVWFDDEGHARPFWSKSWGAPAAAKVVVVKSDGTRHPGIATWDEYVQTNRDGTPNSMWSKMPANQLAKCAEALALRKAYPEDLSGLYSDDEMGQADNGQAAPQQVQSEAHGGPNLARLREAEQQTEQPDWVAMAQEVRDDFATVKAIYFDARNNGAPQDVLDRIKAIGDEAQAVATATAPDPSDEQVVDSDAEVA